MCCRNLHILGSSSLWSTEVGILEISMHSLLEYSETPSKCIWVPITHMSIWYFSTLFVQLAIPAWYHIVSIFDNNNIRINSFKIFVYIPDFPSKVIYSIPSFFMSFHEQTNQLGHPWWLQCFFCVYFSFNVHKKVKIKF